MNGKISIFLSISLILAIFLGGCSQKLKPPKSQATPLPSWFLNPPSSRGLYMYGTAIGTDKTDAVKSALSNIISTLSVNIKSSYNSKVMQHNYYINTKILNSVEAKVSKIHINNFTLVKANQIGYGRIAVLVRIDKTKFVNGLISQLNYQKQSIDIKYNMLNNEGTLARYNSLARLIKATRQMQHVLMIVDELKQYATLKFNRLAYLADIIRVKQRYINQKSELNFFVIAKKSVYGYKEALKNYISQKGFNVSNIKTKNSISVKISLAYTVYSNKYMNIAVVKVLIKAYENSLHVGGRSYTFKERYVGSKTKVYQAALYDFTKALQATNISKALGIML